MSPRVRRAGSTVAILACLLAPAAAHAQGVETTPDPNLPTVQERFPGGTAQETPTPSATPEETATPEPTATATAKPNGNGKGKKGGGDLAHTGADTLPLALGGLTLIAFGIALRLRLALDDARRQYWLS